jgi:hypothetical protein
MSSCFHQKLSGLYILSGVSPVGNASSISMKYGLKIPVQGDDDPINHDPYRNCHPVRNVPVEGIIIKSV